MERFMRDTFAINYRFHVIQNTGIYHYSDRTYLEKIFISLHTTQFFIILVTSQLLNKLQM